MPALDGLTLAQLEREGRNKHEYGKERVYGAISWGIANVFFGPAIDMLGFKTLYATNVLSFIGCIVTFQLYARSTSANEGIAAGDDFFDEKKTTDEDTPMLKPPQKIVNEKAQERITLPLIMQLIYRKAPILNISYIISVFALYIGMSVVESLVFLYFEYLGGSNTMCGLTVAVTVLFELPLFHYAPEMLTILGSPVRMLQGGCVAYIVRVLGYSLLPQSHPYWVLILEPLHGITIAFALTSSVAVADTWVPKGYEATGQGFLSMIRSFGQFVGFCLAAVFEERTLYRVLGAIVAVGTAVLGIGSYLATTMPRVEKSKGSIRNLALMSENQTYTTLE
jgi:Na+/melibiose symporter-like transporter